MTSKQKRLLTTLRLSSRWNLDPDRTGMRCRSERACRKGLGARGQAGHDAEGKGDSSSDHDLCGVQQAIEFTARALWEEYHTDQIRQPAQLLANPQLRLVHGICHYLG